MIKVVVFKEGTKYKCWRTVSKYKNFGNKVPYGMVHRMCANGDSGLIRHRCGDARCINPRHFMSGSYSDNAIDKVEKDQFMYEMLVYYKVYDDLSEVVYADCVANEIKKLGKYEFEKYVDWVWEKLVAECYLVVVDNYKELLEELTYE